jgi:class 3 adenylate cyclase
MQGASALHFYVTAARVTGAAGDIPLVVERDGQRLEVVARRVPFYYGWWRTLPFAIALTLVGLLILLRAPDWHIARRFFAGCVAVSIAFCTAVAEMGPATRFIGLSFLVAQPLGLLLTMKNASEFTAEAMPSARWQKALGWIFAGLSASIVTARHWLPIPFSATAVNAVSESSDGLYALALLAALTRTYRCSGPVGRRQLKWVLYGFYPGCVAIFAGNAARAMEAPYATVEFLSNLTMVALLCVPIGFLIAITAFGLLDIDRLISATASYTALGIGLVTAGLTAVPILDEIVTKQTGLEPTVVRVAMAALGAVLVLALHRGLRPRIEAFFFPERSSIDRGFETLLVELNEAKDSRELVAIAGERIDRIFRPESCVVYAIDSDSWRPVFARGRAVPPAFAHDSPLVRVLGKRDAPLTAEPRGGRRELPALEAFDRAALATLEAAVVLPIRRGAQMVAFLCLGSKRSGDVYTPTDLALLAAVTNQVASHLVAWDASKVAREASEMQRALRRYVPGAVARSLESGGDLESQERAVSILFVDLRGYTAFSEGRAAREIFSTVNRYTQTVSSIVESNGGAVVEFNGDGMMAVFGAPQSLAHKERAAVRAGREIVDQVRTLGADPSEPLTVGVGIATGSAYVGGIEASDRVIWSALGNTTNLAARLQELCRKLDASIAIDVATARGAGDAAADFQLRKSIPLRGRTHEEDVLVLAPPCCP